MKPLSLRKPMQATELLKQLQNPEIDDTAAEQAAIALGELGDTGWAAIESLARAADPDRRFWAVRALWANGSDTAISELLALLNDPNEMVRSAAALALGEMRAETAIADLLTLLETDETSAGNHAADALAKIGTPAAEGLIALLAHPQKLVRLRAAKALVPIKSHDAIRPLIDLLDNDPSYLVRHYADVALKKMGVGQMVYFK